MTADHRNFNERYAALWTERAAARRASGRLVDLAIAGALDRIFAQMRAELEKAPAPFATTAAAPAEGDQITWKSQVFHQGGRFNPFAGSHAEAMFASADACERLGYLDIARAYRESAISSMGAPTHSDASNCRTDAVNPSGDRHWEGPPMPPLRDPAPFVAGEQMGFAL